MNSRQRLHQTFSFAGNPPPRYESEFSEEVIEAWKSQGSLGEAAPEAYFQLDRRETVPIEWRREREDKIVLEGREDLERFQRTYNPTRCDRFPEDWPRRLTQWRQRDFALSISPWNEGFLQVAGIADARSFNRAILMLRDAPAFIEQAMDHYAGYLESLLDRALGESGLAVDYAVFYSPIASDHAPVVSPAAYARFALPAMRRVIERLERHRVAFRFIWTTGRIRSLIPLWIDAGINGFALTHSARTGNSYPELRREYGAQLLLMGGVDWRALMKNPEAVDKVLEENVRPVLEAGGYIPHLDDTVRAYIPFESYCYYRRKLDILIAEVYGKQLGMDEGNSQCITRR